HRVAQDGTRVRASAGAASFRRKPRLEQCLKQARAHLQALQRELEHLDPERGARAQAAQARAAREYQQRVEQALAELPKVAAHKNNRQEAARVSSTDPQARVMKMGDGGFRPAYNVQFATDTESRIIVGVGVSNAGTDTAQLAPMLEQIERRTGKLPEQALVDGGFANFASLERVAADGVAVFAPLRSKNKTYKLDPAQPRSTDSPLIAEYLPRAGGDRRNRERRLEDLARSQSPAGARHRQSPRSSGLVRARLQPDARNPHGLAMNPSAIVNPAPLTTHSKNSAPQNSPPQQLPLTTQTNFLTNSQGRLFLPLALLASSG